jgi:hypothetical protein
MSLLPGCEVGLYLWWKFESIEVSADEPVRIEFLIPGKEVSVEGKPLAISEHVNRKKG